MTAAAPKILSVTHAFYWHDVDPTWSYALPVLQPFRDHEDGALRITGMSVWMRTINRSFGGNPPTHPNIDATGEHLELCQIEAQHDHQKGANSRGGRWLHALNTYFRSPIAPIARTRHPILNGVVQPLNVVLPPGTNVEARIVTNSAQNSGGRILYWVSVALFTEPITR